MPNLKLTDLVTLSGSQLTGDDFLYIVENATNTSRKITFDSLANTRLNTLSAYDLNNTTNIEFLSSRISNNTIRIDSGDTVNTSITNDIDFLSGSIDVNTSDILTVSAIALNNSLGSLGSDVLTISGNVQVLSSLARENEELINGGAADFAFLSSAIDDLGPSNITFLSGAIESLSAKTGQGDTQTITLCTVRGRESADGLFLLSDPDAPATGTGGSMISMFSDDFTDTPSQIYVKSKFTVFQPITAIAAGDEAFEIDANGRYLRLLNIKYGAPPTPSGSGYLYVESGALKFKGSSGTVTTIAPA